MKITRRDLMAGASALAIAGSASALPPQGNTAPSGFNGGRSQGQSTSPILSNDFPFINFIKSGASNWQGRNSYNADRPIEPSWLDTDGYPLASALSGTNGVGTNVSVPTSTFFSDDFVLMWDVTDAGPSDVVQLQGFNAPTTPVSGTLSSTGNGTNFTYRFTLNSSTVGGLIVNITSLGGTAHLTNLRLCHFSEVTRLLAGQVFSLQFLAILRQAKFGIYRFMDWLGPSGPSTTWASRKPVNYFTWSEPEFRASLYAGETTNSGNDYSLTPSGSYAWTGPNGTYAGGAPVDKQTMHIRFNADAALVSNTQTAGRGGTLTINSLSPLTFGWSSHPLANGDIVGITTGFDGGNQIEGTNPGVNYYVVNSATNTFQVALTAGGTPIVASGSGGGAAAVIKPPTLNQNGRGKVPIKPMNTIPNVDPTFVPAGTSRSTQLYGTMVYDADLNTWLLSGGSSGAGSKGLDNGIPPEICLQLCTELGMHPHWSLPPLTLDPATDYAPSLASLCQSTGPSWMVPAFEPGNEIWNTLTTMTNYAMSKSYAHWGTVDGTEQQNQFVGKVLSVMGQGVASVYGLGNLGVTYDVYCPCRTLVYSPELYSETRITASAYVAQAASAQSGYSKVAATSYTSAVLFANYNSPSMRGKISELQNAWDYYYTNVGSPTAQIANLNAFVDTLSDPITGSVTFTNGSATIAWAGHFMIAGQSVVQFSGGSLLANFMPNKNYFVTSIVAGVSFTVAATISGPNINAASNGSGSVLWAPYSYTNEYLKFFYDAYRAWALSKGVNKMRCYEGGYSPDLVPYYDLGHQWKSNVAAASKAAQCVLTIPTTSSVDTQIYIPIGLVDPQAGNPARVGMVLCLQNIGGMTQLNCLTTRVVVTSGSDVIPWFGNILVNGQAVQFVMPNTGLPAQVTAGTTYYAVSVVAGTSFKISATKGGSPITFSFGSLGDTTGADLVSGWVITGVGGALGTNKVSIDIDSTGFSTYTSGGDAYYVNSTGISNNFRIETLMSATHMQALLKDGYDIYTAAGGTFPSQYLLAGVNNIWSPIQPDIWGTQSQEFAAIAAYNH
jgi:hypothetical protein